MMNEIKTNAIQAIKDEFMQRYGVEVDIDLKIYSHKNKVMTKELAKKIVEDYTNDPSGIRHRKDDKDLMIGWFNNSMSYKEDFEICAWYDLGRDDIETN